MNCSKLRVALVGCGQIADAHLQAIRNVPCAKVIALCDHHIDLAAQAAARFGNPETFDDLASMLAKSRPDVVHVTTPPHTHRAVALAAIRAGAHVYVEKPFAINVDETDDILQAARPESRSSYAGHDNLLAFAWQECRRLKRTGKLGRIVHVDSIQGYDLDGPFGKVVSSEPDHWVHRLPGGIFHNTISHAVYKITDFMPDERPQIWAAWFGDSESLCAPTELRVMLKGEHVTANLIFSSLARPVQRLARVYGTLECLEVDLETRLLRHSRPARSPGPFAKIEAPLRHLREAAGSLRRSIWAFVRSDMHFFAGMNRLIAEFYQAIAKGGQPPIPEHEIRRVSAIMDRIFEACRLDKSAATSALDRVMTSPRRNRQAVVSERA